MDEQNKLLFFWKCDSISNKDKDTDIENEFILDTDKIFNTTLSIFLKVIDLFENSLEFSEMRKNLYL